MFKIITDGSCDLNPELAKEKGLTVVPFYVSFDGQTYKKEIEEVGIRDFYEQMVANPGVFPKSSMPSVDDYMKAFMPYVEEKMPIMCICITTKFSGSYNSAMTARDMILEDYPDAKIEVIDAQMNTVLQGLLVLEAVKMRDMGMSLEDSVKRVNEIIPTGRIFFTIGSLDYLLKGGRAGKVAGAIVGTFGIRPIIVLKEGEIHLGGIARGRHKSIDKPIDLLTKHFRETGENIDDYEIVIGFGYDYEESLGFRKKVCEAVGKNESDINICQIGATIAVHTGPYPLGIGIIKKADAK